MISELDLYTPDAIEIPACEYCNTKMIWCECICCADGLIPSGNGEDIPCPVCDGDAGLWICPHEKKHPLPLLDEDE